ncbi:MAG: hypothetical protein ACFHWX_11410 [Bacteroidota bacterium]
MASLVYRLKDLMHTDVPKEISNQRIAKSRTEYELKYALENGLEVLAYCPRKQPIF